QPTSQRPFERADFLPPAGSVGLLTPTGGTSVQRYPQFDERPLPSALLKRNDPLFGIAVRPLSLEHLGPDLCEHIRVRPYLQDVSQVGFCLSERQRIRIRSRVWNVPDALKGRPVGNPHALPVGHDQPHAANRLPTPTLTNNSYGSIAQPPYA